MRRIQTNVKISGMRWNPQQAMDPGRDPAVREICMRGFNTACTDKNLQVPRTQSGIRMETELEDQIQSCGFRRHMGGS